MEEYLIGESTDMDWDFDEDANPGNRKVFVLIIYDIIDNKRRYRLAKFLKGYGFRVQRSSFEATIPRAKYRKLISEIGSYISEEDSLRVYRIRGRGEVTVFGKSDEPELEDVIVI